ncbi:Na/Pi cotransporter family protein [candidate division KSB1 bacterium]
MDTSNSINLFPIIMGVVGGLAIFLFGLDLMTSALKKLAAGKLKDLFSKVTGNRFKAAFMGMFVTAVIQSSSVTTVLVVGFITAGLITMSQSIGIIMGANIGSTVTAQIIAFKITSYALILVAVGFTMNSLGKSDKLRKYGIMIMGLGLIFVGMDIMSNATHPLRTYQPFINMMQEMTNPFLAILISAVFTGIIQSSAATTGIVIMFASQGLITLELGIALAFGANIGTCATAALAAIGKQREAVRAAVVHILFNVIGVLVWIGFIDQLALLIRWFSPTAEGLEGIAKLAAETPRQIANAHTFFNVANTFIFIWFTKPFALIAERLIPKGKETEHEEIMPKYVDDNLLETPDLALDRVRMEVVRLGQLAHQLVKSVPDVIFKGGERDLERLPKMEKDINMLHGYIAKYIGKLSRTYLLKKQSEQLRCYMEMTNTIESIAQVVESELTKIAIARLESGIHISDQTLEIFNRFHMKISWTFEMALQSIADNDKASVKAVLGAKEKINKLVEDINAHLLQRLSSDDPNRRATYRLETDVVEYLKRVYYFAKQIAKNQKEIMQLEKKPKQEDEKENEKVAA